MSYWPYFAHFEADERHTKSMDTWHNLTRERFGSKAYRDPWPGTWHHQPSIVFEKQLRLLLSTAQPDSTLLSHSLMNLMNLNTHTDEKHLRILVSNVRGKKDETSMCCFILLFFPRDSLGLSCVWCIYVYLMFLCPESSFAVLHLALKCLFSILYSSMMFYDIYSEIFWMISSILN